MDRANQRQHMADANTILWDGLVYQSMMFILGDIRRSRLELDRYSDENEDLAVGRRFR